MRRLADHRLGCSRRIFISEVDCCCLNSFVLLYMLEVEVSLFVCLLARNHWANATHGKMFLNSCTFIGVLLDFV